MNCDKYICKSCYEDNSSHSFYKINNFENISLKNINLIHILNMYNTSIYYTCSSKSTKYYDRNGIINHFENMLNFNNEKEWIWIFDGYGFELKHALEIQTAISISKIISNKYKNILKKIIIINPSWHIKNALNLLWVFLDDDIKSLIIIDE